MKNLLFRIGLVVLFFCCASLAIGSQVADVAKKERERRQKISTPAKVFTNEDIAAFKARNKEETSTTAPDEEQESQESGAVYEEPAAGSNAADEAYWRGRYKDATDKVKDLQAQADKLQKTINGLLLNVTNYGGAVVPQLNAQIGEMKDQLEQINKDLAAAKQAMEDLQEEARRAGALPGWVRD